MPRRALSLAVVGYGYWGSKHVRVFSGMPDVEVTIVEHDPVRRAAANRTFRSTRIANSLEDALPTVDAVVIATPPRTHSALALMAARAGRHVLVEKPLGTSVVECEELIDVAKEHGALLMAGHTFEYNAAVWKLRELAASGALGRIRYVDCARLNLGLFQSDVNVIWDLAPHDVSIVNFVLGCLPTAVSAWGHSHANRGLEDVAHVHLRYADSDVRAYIHVSWLDPCKVRRVTVVGSEKMAVYNDMSANERIRIYDAGVEVDDAPNGVAMHEVPVTYRRGDIVAPFVAVEEPLLVQDSHFVDCIRTGSHPRTDGMNGLQVASVLEAANKALRAGHEVAIDTRRAEPVVIAETTA
jgi:predicted dehydrogenase